MDLRALWEAVAAVGFTPFVSIVMALIVVIGIVLLFRRFYRR